VSDEMILFFRSRKFQGIVADSPATRSENPQPELAVLQLLRARLKPGQRWAAYKNQTGEFRFLKVDESVQPPTQYPSVRAIPGRGHLFIGYVDLSTGKIVEERP
jgi:hypothetical protein